jgi:hypothetical protein
MIKDTSEAMFELRVRMMERMHRKRNMIARHRLTMFFVVFWGSYVY